MFILPLPVSIKYLSNREKHFLHQLTFKVQKRRVKRLFARPHPPSGGGGSTGRAVRRIRSDKGYT